MTSKPTHIQRGLYFEEFEIGAAYVHRPGRTVNEADNTFFSTMTMNTQGLHLDAAWSEAQPNGQRVVNSMFTLSTMVGSSVTQLTLDTIFANLGFTNVKFLFPLFHGDTIYSETSVLSKRLSKTHEGKGIISLLHSASNQNEIVVATAERSVMVWCEEAHKRNGIASNGL